MGITLLDTVHGAADVRGSLCFTRPGDVAADQERPGMLRAQAKMFDADGDEHFAVHDCTIRDRAVADCAPCDLAGSGFDSIHLDQLTDLQVVLERVRQNRRIAEDDGLAIRRGLKGRSFRLNDGRILRLLLIAPEGLILRKAGPNGSPADPHEAVSDMNGHVASQAVHSDQDVYGTPVRQILRGFGPWLFRHDSPNGANRRSPVFLVNIWIPLDQVTRPLTLMDQRSLDRQRHQLRYALPTDGFLQRDAESRVNDIWAFLHDDAQAWYFTSDMDAKRAYVFNTLSTPHGAFILPGEAAAEQGVIRLRAVRDALRNGDAAAVMQQGTALEDDLPEDMTAPLRRAIQDMDVLLAEARDMAQSMCADARLCESWTLRAEAVMDRLIRKSIELRAVAIVLPDIWPFNRFS